MSKRKHPKQVRIDRKKAKIRGFFTELDMQARLAEEISIEIDNEIMNKLKAQIEDE